MSATPLINRKLVLSSRALGAILGAALASAPKAAEPAQDRAMAQLLNELLPPCDDPSCEACAERRAADMLDTSTRADEAAEHRTVSTEIPGDVAQLVGLSPDYKGADLTLKLHAAAFITEVRGLSAQAKTGHERARLDWALRLVKEAVGIVTAATTPATAPAA